MIFFCIHMLVAVGNDTEHIPNTSTNDDHCPSEAHRDDRPRAPNRAGPGAGRWSRNFPDNRCQELAQGPGEVTRRPPRYVQVLFV